MSAIVKWARSPARIIAPPAPASPVHRPIRSFVLRQGRMSAAQQRACDELYPRYGVPASASASLDLAAIFGNALPVVLEIGSGMGETTVQIAAATSESRSARRA